MDWNVSNRSPNGVEELGDGRKQAEHRYDVAVPRMKPWGYFKKSHNWLQKGWQMQLN